MRRKRLNCVNNEPLVFQIADLVTLFQSRVVQLGVELPDIHATRLTEKLLFHIPQMRAYSKGRNVLLAYDTDVGYILAHTSKYGEAIQLAAKYVPPSRVACVGMIEHGADIKS